MIQSRNLAEELRKIGCVVDEATIITTSEDFVIEGVGRGTVFSGRIDIRGNVVIGENAFIDDSSLVTLSSSDKTTRIDKGVKIFNSLIVDTAIGDGTNIERCDLFGCQIGNSSRLKDMVMCTRKGSQKYEGMRNTPTFDHAGLEILTGASFEALEKVFGVTLDLGAAVYVEKKVKQFLQDMLGVSEREGGLKKFDKKFVKELRALAFNKIPGLERYDLKFYVGTNSFFSGTIVLRGNVNINPWCVIHNSMIAESNVERGAIIWNSVVRNSTIRSSVKNQTIIDRENISETTVEQGWKSPGSEWKKFIIFRHGE